MNALADLSPVLSAGSLAALPLALAGGFLAGLNPCCLALYPAAVGVCCAPRDQARNLSLPRAAGFVLGIAVAVAALGLLAAYIGRIAVLATPIRYGIALIPIVMGLDRLGWLRLPWKTPTVLQRGVAGAFGTGLLLSLIIGPCGTPVLASVLAFAAYKQSFIYGGMLLLAYGFGNGLPLVLVGTAGERVLNRLYARGYEHRIDMIVGSVLLVLGFYLLWRV